MAEARGDGRARGVRAWIAAAAGGALLFLGYSYCNGGLRVGTLDEQRLEERGAALRIRAAAARTCDAGRYADCLRLYDEAKRFDPGGDDDPEVKRARSEARSALPAPSGEADAASARD